MADLAERLEELGEQLERVPRQARDRWWRSRLERLERRNERLSEEVGRMRDELDRERALRAEATRAPARTRARPSRGRRLLRAAVIGVGAYLLGARAGNERYETVRAWAERMTRKAQGLVGSSEEDMPGIERTRPTP